MWCRLVLQRKTDALSISLFLALSPFVSLSLSCFLSNTLTLYRCLCLSIKIPVRWQNSHYRPSNPKLHVHMVFSTKIYRSDDLRSTRLVSQVANIPCGWTALQTQLTYHMTPQSWASPRTVNIRLRISCNVEAVVFLKRRRTLQRDQVGPMAAVATYRNAPPRAHGVLGFFCAQKAVLLGK